MIVTHRGGLSSRLLKVRPIGLLPEKASRERLTYQSHWSGAWFQIARLEIAALHNPHAGGLKEAGRCEEEQAALVVGREAGNPEESIAGRPVERAARGKTGRFHTGDRGYPLLQFFPSSRQALVAIDAAKPDAGYDHILPVKAGIRVRQVDQGTNKGPGAENQNHRDAHLQNHRQFSAADSFGTRECRPGAESVERIDGRGPPRRA